MIKKVMLYLLPLLFLGLIQSGCLGVRWQEKETYILVYEIEPYSSSGYVLPVPLAQVAVSGNGYSSTKYTDSQGKTMFLLSPGTYTVQISKDGYESVSDTITIYTLELTPGYYPFYLVRQ